MKTRFIAFALSLSMFFISHSSFSQISEGVIADMTIYKDIIPRTLLVEIREEDAEVLADFQLRIDKTKKQAKKDTLAKERLEYQSIIKNYNALIKPTILKYWTFNKKIEFKTTSEIKALSASDHKKYVVFYFKNEGDNASYGMETSMVVPFIYYNRLEVSHFFAKRPTYPDYKMYLPSSFIRPLSEYTTADIIFTIKAMQLNMVYNSTNPKRLSFIEYSRLRAEQNCSLVKSKTVLIEKVLKDPELNEQDLKSTCQANYVFADPAAITKTMEDVNTKNAVVISFPYGLAKHGSGVQVTFLVYVKVIVDAKTGEVLNYYQPKFSQSKFYEGAVKKPILIDLCGCTK